MRYLKNLSSQELHSGVLPWEYKPTSPIPEEVRGNKTERDAWINRPATDHCVYTTFEGVNPHLRISKLKSDESGNPVHCQWALVADYDSPQPEAAVLKFASELPYPPNWIERTLSGNWRFIWLLEEPLIYPSYKFARHFLKVFPEIAFDPSRGSVGFDKKAWEAPERLYTNACDWRKFSDKVIPANVSRGWLVQASEKFKFTGADFGTVVPIELAKVELEKRYPRFAEWPGEFAVNAQGPTFWVDASVSPKSAIVRETGIQTFSANAAKGFYSWADLIGIAFVKQYQSEAIGRAVEGVHFDGRHYWRQVINETWHPFEKGDFSLHLRATRGVSPKPDTSGVSDVDRAIEFVQSQQRINGAAPFVYQAPGIITRPGKRYLNTSTIRVLAPAEGVAVWGPKGQFPWVSLFLDDYFTTREQLDVLLAWAHWAYKGFYNYAPQQGQVLFLAGPVGTGKTLLSRLIIGSLFGGFAEAAAFLLGEDNFNAELLGVGLWCVDDTNPIGDPVSFRKWNGGVKRVGANTSFRFNEKFRTASTAEWTGRLIVTCNADEESIRIIPDANQNILDKLVLLRVASRPGFVFPERYELKRILDRELPWLARYLLDYKVPQELRGDARHGIKAYAEQSLLETSKKSSHTAGFHDILEDWRDQFFRLREPNAKFWEGTAFQLHKQLMLDPSAEAAMRAYTVDNVQRQLLMLKGLGIVDMEVNSKGESRIFKIFRDK